MSKDNKTSEKSAEKPKDRKLILLGVLGVVLIGAIYLQLFSGGNSGEKTPVGQPKSTAARSSPTPARVNQKTDEIVSQPLDDLASLTNRASAAGGTGRNIFIYPTPTPVPPPRPPSPTPTPVPPPVTLFTINPASVVARTTDFTLTLYGAKIPQDAKVYLNGRDFPATFVSEREIRAKVTADAIRNGGALGIQVRSASDAKLFSNSISLNVSEPPPPPYRYIGIIVEKKGPTAVLKSQGGEVEFFRVVRDQKFGTNWRVVSIDAQKIVVEDTRIKVTHSIEFTGEESR